MLRLSDAFSKFELKISKFKRKTSNSQCHLSPSSFHDGRFKLQLPNVKRQPSHVNFQRSKFICQHQHFNLNLRRSSCNPSGSLPAHVRHNPKNGWGEGIDEKGGKMHSVLMFAWRGFGTINWDFLNRGHQRLQAQGPMAATACYQNNT